MKLADLKPCLIQTEDNYLLMGRTEGVERDGRLTVYVAWDDLPADYKQGAEGETKPQFVSVDMPSESVVVE